MKPLTQEQQAERVAWVAEKVALGGRFTLAEFKARFGIGRTAAKEWMTPKIKAGQLASRLYGGSSFYFDPSFRQQIEDEIVEAQRKRKQLANKVSEAKRKRPYRERGPARPRDIVVPAVRVRWVFDLGRFV